MKRILPLLTLSFALFTLPPAQAEELQAPDVNFYADVQTGRSDFEPFEVDDATSLTLRAGMWLNDLNKGKSRFGLEGGLFRLGEDSVTENFTREPTVSDGQNTDFVEVQQRRTVRINGLSFGGLWNSGYGLQLRAGAYLYDFKDTMKQRRVLVDTDTDPDTRTTVNDIPESESESSLAPYIGAGYEVKIWGPLYLLADYTLVQVESERIDNVSVGFRFQGR